MRSIIQPVDRDLQQMTDKGCPLDPNPAEENTTGGRDNLGELDTIEAVPEEQSVQAVSRWQRLRNQVVLRERWKTACEVIVRRADTGMRMDQY